MSREHEARILRVLKTAADGFQTSDRKAELRVDFETGAKYMSLVPMKSVARFIWVPQDRAWYWKWLSHKKVEPSRSTRPETWVRAYMRRHPEQVAVDVTYSWGESMLHKNGIGRKSFGMNNTVVNQIRKNKAARVVQAAVRGHHTKRNAAARTIQSAYKHHLYKPGGRGMTWAWQNFDSVIDR